MKSYTREDAKRAVGKGWHKLIDEVFDELGDEDCVWSVKEKWGGLRISGAFSERLENLVWNLENESFEICEICGRPGKPRKGAWILTLCWWCAFKRKVKNED